jgi:hypothetical protein
MATAALPTTSPSIVDVAKRTGADGRMIPVVQALAQDNFFLQTMHFKEGNLDTGHRVASENALPSVSWVRVNEGITPSTSNSDTYDETTGMLEGLSSIDPRLANMNGNAAEYRASKDDAFVAQMSNTLESAFFYESTAANPERILGLAARLGSTTGKYGKQIILCDAAAAGADQNSLYLIGWGEHTAYGISPRGKASGLQMDDKGEVRTTDALGKVIYKLETLFHWDVGFCVEDYRAIVRVANIDSSLIAANGTNLITAAIKATHQVRKPGARFAWYTNKFVGTYLHLQAYQSTANGTMSIQNYGGQQITTLLGYPVYETDALTSTEAPVV